MILVIPAMDLFNGHCERCPQGEPGTEPLYAAYSDSPVMLAQLWRRENAKSIQVTDRDGLTGDDNSLNRNAILAMTQAIDIPITLRTKIASVNEASYWLEHGVYRIIVGDLARRDGAGLQTLLRDYTPSRIAFGIVANAGSVQQHSDLPPITDIEYAAYLKELGGTRIVYTDIRWEGTLAGPDFNILRHFACSVGMRVTAAGGIANVEQLWRLQELEPFGLDSVVIGRAFYENCFPCQKIWRLAEAQLETDTHPNLCNGTDCI